MTQDSVEQQIYDLFTRASLTLGTAESCTGGLVSYRLVTVPGSSEYFLGGVVAYSNELKHQTLGVSNETLRNVGAVSEQCAREMAEGIRALTGATIGVSTTGIAGPGGATARKPVGLIYIACASPRGTQVYEGVWNGDRTRNMADATSHALQMVIDEATSLRSDSEP